MNPFKNKRIRSGFNGATNRQWFSIVDIIAAAMGIDYQQARNYWKWLKRKFAKQQGIDICSLFFQMKMEAADGKLRKTDVVDAEGIADIINAIPSPKAADAKLWLRDLAEKGKDAARLFSETAVRHRTGSRLFHTTRVVIYDRSAHEPQSVAVRTKFALAPIPTIIGVA